MITREQYLEALAIIDEYHRQKPKDVLDNKNRETIREWIARQGKISTRLERTLLSPQAVYLGNREWKPLEYVDEVNRRQLLRIRNAGIKTWNEFRMLREKDGIEL